MRRINKWLILITIFSLTIIPAISIDRTSAIDQTNLKKTRFVIDWIKVTDQFYGYNYKMSFSVSFARIYGSYGEKYSNDIDYSAHLFFLDYDYICSFNGASSPINTIIFGSYSDYYSDVCYAPDLSEAGYELKVHGRIESIYPIKTDIDYHYFGGVIEYNTWYRYTYSFPNFSGSIQIRYKVITE
ncbi:MAG: hypothetical protein K9W44_08680 [Candidatus Lokiarchaeota archaeon]|nr:hypothetical protein [Candidatus Harpocratesius repetitus]